MEVLGVAGPRAAWGRPRSLPHPTVASGMAPRRSHPEPVEQVLGRLAELQWLTRPATGPAWEWTPLGQAHVTHHVVRDLVLARPDRMAEWLRRPTRLLATGADWIAGTAGGDQRWLVCRRCGMTSFNPHDVAERYCGRCHVFLDEGVSA
jgi:hypothetical protein